MRIRAIVVFVSVCLVGPVSRVEVAVAQEPAKPRLRIAVYVDAGAGASKVLKALAAHPEWRVDRIKAKQIQDGGLIDYDVVVFPGGSGGKQGRTLDSTGREQVRAFVEGGGGYVGVCAGAYLATCDYSWSLGVLNAKVVDKKHWNRGVGDVDVALSPQARKILGRKEDRLIIHYHQGPLLAPGDEKRLPSYDAWGRFEGEVAKKGAPKGVMKGTTAIAAAVFGKGRVLCFSPHPELTKGLADLLLKGISWTAEK